MIELSNSPFSDSPFSSPIKKGTQRSFKSPSYSSPRKTLVGDRFIPVRSEMDLDISNFNLLKENTQPNTTDTTPSHENYKLALAESLFNGKMSSPKVLTFSSPRKSSNSPLPKASPIRLLNSSMEGSLPSSPLRQNNRVRIISNLNPEKVLDAPEIVDDYYLNLLDWSTDDIVGIALARSVYIWNAATGKSSQLLSNQDDNNIITSLSFSKTNGNLLAVGTNDAEVQIWDVEKARMIRQVQNHASRVSALDWSRSVLTSGSRDSMIHNHDIRTMSMISTMQNHSQEVCGLKWSPDGTCLASGGNDNILNIWDLHRPRAPKFSLAHHQAAVKALAWCPWQNNLLASGGGTADRTLRFWNTSNGTCINSIDTKSQVCAIQWSTQNKELVSSHGYSQNQLIVWKYPSMQKIAELKGHTSRVLHLAKSPDGKTVASAAGDETLRFWKIFDYQEVKGSKAQEYLKHPLFQEWDISQAREQDSARSLKRMYSA